MGTGNEPDSGKTERMLYSLSMNRALIIALVACVILFILAVLIAPTIDLEPSALRAQQWLSLITTMFSLAALFKICFQIMTASVFIGAVAACDESEQQVSSASLCPLRC